MITSCLKWLMIAGLTAGFAGAAQAEEFDIGKWEFQSSCASCHGADGKGNGPVSEQLKVPPPDLTLLAKKNNGGLPHECCLCNHRWIANICRSRKS
jgi:mono/diheme cytochrome c family protein